MNGLSYCLDRSEGLGLDWEGQFGMKLRCCPSKQEDSKMFKNLIQLCVRLECHREGSKPHR